MLLWHFCQHYRFQSNQYFKSHFYIKMPFNWKPVRPLAGFTLANCLTGVQWIKSCRCRSSLHQASESGIISVTLWQSPCQIRWFKCFRSCCSPEIQSLKWTQDGAGEKTSSEQQLCRQKCFVNERSEENDQTVSSRKECYRNSNNLSLQA